MTRSALRRVTVVGLGLIGGSVALALRRSGPRCEVVGFDRAPVMRRALRRRVVDRASPSLGAALRGTEMVVLALPVDDILSTLPQVARFAPAGAVVTDVGSTKQSIVRAARRAGMGDRFVGGHPMAGSDRSGVAHAEAGLFEAAPWILCSEGASTAAVGRVMRLVRRVGGRPALMTARRHDELVARLSHLPQLASVALVNAAARSRATSSSLRLSGPGFRQMGRLAGSSPRLWRGILRTNRNFIGAALRDFERELARLRDGLERGASADFVRAARVLARLRRS